MTSRKSSTRSSCVAACSVTHQPCPTVGSSAFVTPAVADITAAGAVTAIAVDDENDAAYYEWVVHHFPSQWRHAEQNGPTYGPVLLARLQRRFPCAAGVPPLPGSTAAG